MDSRPIFVISAPSGTGKNSLIRILLDKEPRLTYSISSTTRTKRSNEEDGVSYHFLSHAEFKKRMEEGEFLESAQVLDNFYGTEKREIQRIHDANKFPILDIDIQGAQSLREKKVPLVSFFIAPPSLEELRQRLRKRGSETEEQIQKRLELAKLELLQKERFDYTVVNDRLERAAEELLEKIHSHIGA